MGKHSGKMFLCCLIAMPACANILPGVQADNWQIALIAGAVLGVFSLLLRPVIRLLTLPIGCLTLGASGFAIDTGLIVLMSTYVPGFYVQGLQWAALCALMVHGLCMATSWS